MTFQPNLKLREAVFRKMGWKLKADTNINSKHYSELFWWTPSGVRYKEDELPPIETDWSVTAQFLAAFMRERGFDWEVSTYPYNEGKYFVWIGKRLDGTADIHNDNISEAACRAFLEVQL